MKKSKYTITEQRNIITAHNANPHGLKLGQPKSERKPVNDLPLFREDRQQDLFKEMQPEAKPAQKKVVAQINTTINVQSSEKKENVFRRIYCWR